MASQPPPGITSPSQSQVSAPPGLGMPPGLNSNNNGSNNGVNAFNHMAAQQQQMQQQFQQQQQAHAYQQQQGAPSELIPQTSNAQLAQLLAGVSNQSNDLLHAGGFNQTQGLQQQQQQPPQVQGAGFPSSFGVGFGGGGGGGMASGPGPQSSNPCRMHQQGHCRYGQTCRFTHIGPAGGGAHSGGFGQNNFGGGAFGAQRGFGGPAPAFGAQSQLQPQAFANRNAFGHNQAFGGQQQGQQQPQQQMQQQSFQSRGSPDGSSAAAHADGNQADGSNAESNGASFPAAGQQQQASQVQAPQQQSGFGQAAYNPNVLLQALLMQQQMTASAGAPTNVDLDNLIASLAKTQMQPQQQQQQQQQQSAVPAPASAAAPADQSLNKEFLQAQQALASLATASQRPPQQQQQQQPQGFNNSYQNRNGPSGGNAQFGGVNYGNKHNQHHQQQSHFGGHGGGGHHSHGQSLPSFHTGGNFGSSLNPVVAPPQMRILSDHNNRDPRRELELFGPAHTTTTGINFDMYDAIPVEVTGNEVPGEMKSFSDFDFPDVIRQNIELCKYVKPTPIQKHALPVAFMGRDVMACAQTGSGKTAAFLLPFIAHLVINGRPAPMGGVGRNRRYCPVGLVLAPTRELATQIHLESLKLTYCTSIHSVVVYGGQDIRQQFRELDRGCDIIIATPGRLMDFVERGRISLAQISYLCLDEADRMLDMGFEPQIRSIVLGQDMSENRQTLMFSATFPKEIQRLAQDFLYNYIFIAVGRVGASSDFITQSVEWVAEENKRVQLMSLLPNFKGLTLIFVERKLSADVLETYLNREGYHASSIHGDRSQHERESALAQFRNGRCPILVATDVAARGLDIPNVLDVVNFDMPNSIDDYVHRIGRTGRAGNTGNAWSFVNDKASHLFKDLFEMLHENKQVVPQWLTTIIESSGGRAGGMQRGGHGNRRFGGKDYRQGGQGYGQHKGGRGGMAHGGMAKRFQHGHQQQQGHGHGHGHGHGQQQSQQQGMFAGGQQHQQGGGGMFPGSGAGGFNAGGAMRPSLSNPGAFNLATAMTGRPFPQQQQGGQSFNH